MQPSKFRRMLAVISTLERFAVVFKAPGAIPDFLVVGCNHSAFAAGRQNLVLATGECGDIPKGANRTVFRRGAESLRAIFDHFDSERARERKDRIHIARPAS